MRQGREDKRGKSASAHHVKTGDTVVHGLTAMARVARHTCKTDEWIIDSGATHHISPNLMDFHEYHPLEGFLQVESADSVSLVTAAGSINLQLDCGMLLRVKALYVPDFRASLLLVPQLIKDGIDVSFRSHSRAAYITSEGFTEQPLGRCAPSGSISFVLLSNVTSKKGYPNSTAYQANALPRSDSVLVPRWDSELVPRSDSESVPRSDSESVPRSDSESVPCSDSESVPRSDTESAPRSDSESAPRSDSAFRIDIQTWHQRLGHLNLSDVQKLLPKGSYSENETATSTA